MTVGSDAILERMMALHPKIIDLTLDRMHRLLDALGNPEQRLPPVIHVAGTNGKGSTQAMIRAGLEAAGHRVHAYTSPHLVRFHERIRLAGEVISEAKLTEYLDRCYEANGGEEITYFEITTCAGLLAMSETPADYTLLEVGLGGRLDATNVMVPKLSVITPVDLDHQAFLGETLEEIAGEKAGIIKRGVPCVVSPQHEAAMDVIEARAERLGAPLVAHGQQWHVGEEHGRLVFQDETGLLDLPLPRLAGPHQIINAGAAIAALRTIGEGSAEAAVTHAQWPGRMQRLTEGALPQRFPQAEFWLDGGHNPAAGEAVARTLAGMAKRPTQLICGMLSTKDINGYLSPLAAHADHLTAVTIPGEASALFAGEIAEVARDVGLTASATEGLWKAVTEATKDDPQARVLICGSLYFVGHALRENG